jgi:F0F1-type ATP synthase membrane subunit b/b'
MLTALPQVTMRASLRVSLIALAVGLTGAGSAWSQSLEELYTAARSYDPTYLSARALADSSQYKAAQADALMRPTANLTASANMTRTETNMADISARSRTASLSARQPLFNRTSSATIDQELKNLREDLRREAITAATTTAEATVRASIGAEDQRRLADEYLAGLEAAGTEGARA